MNWNGIILGLITFLTIALLRYLVIKAEYYFGSGFWLVFLIVGILCLFFSFWVSQLLVSAAFAVFGFSSLWGILEIKDQKKRVEDGWYPINPKREKQKK